MEAPFPVGIATDCEVCLTRGSYTLLVTTHPTGTGLAERTQIPGHPNGGATPDQSCNGL
jgi:hypothetical protein